MVEVFIYVLRSDFEEISFIFFLIESRLPLDFDFL